VSNVREKMNRTALLPAKPVRPVAEALSSVLVWAQGFIQQWSGRQKQIVNDLKRKNC
jgi:hypothetical protein